MKVFISYSPEDTATLEELVAEMQLVLPQVEFRYDQANDRGTDAWWERVKRSITSSDIFLLLLSQNWLGSKANRKEYSLARKLEKQLLTAKIQSGVRVPNALEQSGQLLDLSAGVQESADTDALFAALGVVPGAVAQPLEAEPMSAPIPFDDLNTPTRPGTEQVPDDLLAPGVTISPAPVAPDAPDPVTAPPAQPDDASAMQRLPLFSIITLLSFVAVLVGIVLIGLNVLEWGLLILLGGVILGAILSLVVFIQRRQ
jgi:hypothetical protein